MTTDEMDGLFTEEDVRERHNYWCLCKTCGGWTYLTREVTACVTCGGKSFDPQSATSKRTFDEARAKKRSAETRKKNEKSNNRV